MILAVRAARRKPGHPFGRNVGDKDPRWNKKIFRIPCEDAWIYANREAEEAWTVGHSLHLMQARSCERIAGPMSAVCSVSEGTYARRLKLFV